jgi:acyl dehydratase
MNKQSVVEKLKDRVGQVVGVSDWLVIDQKRIDQFAECTEDHQWIHVDEEKAARGPFGKTIAHGFLTLSLLSAMGNCIKLPFDKSEVQMAINYGLNKVRFLNPVPVNSKVRTRVALAGVEEKAVGRVLLTYSHTIEIEGQDKPACIAENLGMVFLK